MILALDEALQALRGHAGPQLVSAAAFSAIDAVAATLPAVISHGCLEGRLGPGVDRVDLSVCVKAEEGRAALLSLAAKERGRLAGPAWDRALALCADWADAGSPLHDQVPFVWIEFDIEGEPRRARPPFLGLCVQPGLQRGPLPERSGDRPVRAAEEERFVALVERAMALLQGSPLSPGILRSVRRCHFGLPPSGHVLYVAPLSGRGLDAVRLALSMPRAAVLPYLERIGWTGTAREVEPLLRPPCSYSGSAIFDLDVGEAVLPRIGFEYKFQTPDPRARLLLDHLVALGSCGADRRDAALSFIGEEELPRRGQVWPSLLFRTLDIKIVVRPSVAPEAKAYLFFGQQLSLFRAPRPPGTPAASALDAGAALLP